MDGFEDSKRQDYMPRRPKSTKPSPQPRLARRTTRSTSEGFLLRTLRGESRLDDTANSRMRARLLKWVSRNVWANLVGPDVATMDGFERLVQSVMHGLPQPPRLQYFHDVIVRARVAVESRGRRPDKDADYMAALTARHYYIERLRLERGRAGMKMAGHGDVRGESIARVGALVSNGVLRDAQGSEAKRRRPDLQARRGLHSAGMSGDEDVAHRGNGRPHRL